MVGIDQEFWLTLITAMQWAIRLGALAYVPFRRSPEAAKGWLLLFFVAPMPALALYFFIGRARHPKWRRQRVRMLPKVIGKAIGNARMPMERRAQPVPTKFEPVADLAQAIGRLPPVASSGIELEPDYDRMVLRLAEDIDAARDHVHLMFYIFEDDETGDRILRALERAAARGVDCRLLIDAFGSFASRHAIARRLDGSGVQLQLILPFRFFGKTTRSDMRNHRKIAILDGRVGWVGSQNIVNAKGEASAPNRELMARVTGPVVAELQIVFIGDWFLETETELQADGLFPELGPGGGGAAQIVASGPDYARARIDMLFVAAIEAARERVVLTTPYFIPSEPLLFALRAAALRGLCVQLIVSAESDSRIIDLAQSSYFLELLEAGVRVSLYERNFLHAKHVSVDGEIAIVGSSNLDMRSFELNSEVTLVSYEAEVARSLCALETQYLAGSRHLDIERWRGRRGVTKFAANIARLVSPLL